MRRKVIGVGAALVLAIVGTLLLTNYVQGAEDRALEGEERVEVYVVDQTIEAGTPGEDIADRVRTEAVPNKVRPDAAVVDLDELVGRVASTDLLPGEQLVSSRFISLADFDRDRPELINIPEGLHEVTFSLEPERAIGGEIKPGDTVAFVGSFEPFELGGTNALALVKELAGDGGVQVVSEGIRPEDFLVRFPGGFMLAPGDSSPSMTSMLLHKLYVTKVQIDQLPNDDNNEEEQGRLAPSGNLLVTLAGDAHQVERMVFTKEFGRVWLSYEPQSAEETDNLTTFPMVLFRNAQAFEAGEDLDAPTSTPDEVLASDGAPAGSGS